MALLSKVSAYIRARVQHRSQAEDGNNQLLLPHWPIQWIVGVLAGLRGKNDVGIPSRAMFEAMGQFFRMSGLIIQ